MIIFTDGSSKKYQNTWCGGIGIYFPRHKKLNVKSALENGTNQSAELFACVIGILNCLNINVKKIHIYSDSLYAINCATIWGKMWEGNNWKKGKLQTIENLEIIKILYCLVRKYNVIFTHINSHQKEPKKKTKEWKLWHGNDVADHLAKKGLAKCLMIKKSKNI